MFAADISIGLAVVAILAVALISILSREQRVAQRTAGARAATRAAEAVLADLQGPGPARAPAAAAAGPAAPGEGDAIVSIRRADGGAAVPGHAWVRVRATVAEKSVELVGLVPDGPELRRREARTPATGEAP